MRLNLTQNNIAALAYADGPQIVVRDTELAGFYLLVGARSKAFMVQVDLRLDGVRKTLKVRIGDAAEMSARDARAAAKIALGQISKGTDPRGAKGVDVTPTAVLASPTSPAPESASRHAAPADPHTFQTGPTLREAWGRYLELHLIRKERAQATIDQYHDHMERLLAAWLDRPLAELAANPREVADRHEAMTRDNGPAIADSAMRSFRAVFNHARKSAPAILTFNPAVAVDWNPHVRRDTALGPEDLPKWFEEVAALENPIRREFHLLSVLTGSRPEALKNVRWVHIDLRRRIMHIPRPKGGSKKAFDIPMSPEIIRSLARLWRLGRILYPRSGDEWVFPSDAPSGRLVEHGELRTIVSHWGNDLRQTYRTLGQASEVPDLDMHLLMNHAVQGINPGYITRAKLLRSHLRRQQTRVSRFIVQAVIGGEARPSSRVRNWLRSSSQAQLDALLGQSPDAVRACSGPRSAVRKLEVQAARCLSQGLSTQQLEAPSRRHAPARPPTRREQLAVMLERLRSSSADLR